MKTIQFLLITLFFTITVHPFSVQANELQAGNENLEDALLAALQPHISDSIIGHYGYDKPYHLYDAQVLHIQREKDSGFSFTVEIQVNTFETAENPPFGKETMQFSISPKGVKLLDYKHVGDDEEKKLSKFYKEVLIDIKQSFHLNLLSFERYNYNQLRYKAEKQNDFDSLAHIAEEIIINILSPDIQPPYKNVIDPVTFVKDNEAFILFKKADGTNNYYRVEKEKGIWKVVEQESGKGEKMEYELLWYM